MNALLATLQAEAGGLQLWLDPLRGFAASTWVIVVVNGLGGLLVAARWSALVPCPPVQAPAARATHVALRLGGFALPARHLHTTVRSIPLRKC